MENFVSFVTFLEARRNPEQNPKISVYEALLPYSDKDDYYISLTEKFEHDGQKSPAGVKLGINPRSEYNTPLGIYTYPLKAVWKKYNIDKSKSLSSLPFAGTQPSVWLLKAKPEGFLDDFNSYGDVQYANDLQKLKQIFVGEFGRDDGWDTLVKDAERTTKKNTYFCEFWNLTRLMGIAFHGDRHERFYYNTEDKIGSKGAAFRWNAILRECGYTGFADKTGQGIIHPAEPVQAVFLSKDAFTVIDRFDNKDYVEKAYIKDNFVAKTSVSKNNKPYDKSIEKTCKTLDNFSDLITTIIQGKPFNDAATYLILNDLSDFILGSIVHNDSIVIDELDDIELDYSLPEMIQNIKGNKLPSIKKFVNVIDYALQNFGISDESVTIRKALASYLKTKCANEPNIKEILQVVSLE